MKKVLITVLINTVMVNVGPIKNKQDSSDGNCIIRT